MHLVNVILPIFFVLFVGFIIKRTISIDPTVLSKLAIYVFIPFLVFRTFYNEPITAAYGYMAMALVGIIVGIILLVTIFSTWMKVSEQERCGLVLSSAFMNNGNYGTPLVIFLFGAASAQIAVVLMVMQQLLMATIGVYYAAKGGEAQLSVKQAISRIGKMPMVYAALFGFIFQTTGVPLQTGILAGVELIASAAIPFIMLSLGVQLGAVQLTNIEWKNLSLATSLRLIVSPLLALGLVTVLPLDSLTKQVIVILAATPTAANTTIYAMQFQTDPMNVSAATLVTTILSALTLPVVIVITGMWV